MSPFVTSKQEQICAVSGNESTPIAGLLPACAGKIKESGCSGNSMVLSDSCKRLP